MIKAIFFDVGGVLASDDSKAILRRQAKILGVKPKELNAVMKLDRRLLMKGKITRREYLRRISRKLKSRMLSALDLAQIYPPQVKSFPQTLIIAQRLWRNGYTVGIITNAVPPHQSLHQVKLQYPPFRPVIRSYAVGLIKPEPRIYRLAVKRAGVRFRESAFLDDRKVNVVAARELGIAAFQYKNPTQLVRSLRRLGVRV